MGSLTFKEPDRQKYPCMELAYGAGKAGGLMPAVLNAANEQAVALFIEEKISFLDIPRVIEKACDRFLPPNIATPSLDDIIAADRWTREAVMGASEELNKEDILVAV